VPAGSAWWVAANSSIVKQAGEVNQSQVQTAISYKFN